MCCTLVRHSVCVCLESLLPFERTSSQAYCAVLDCPTGMVAKPGVAEDWCAKAGCTAGSDIVQCCEPKGRCKALDCGTGLTLRPNPDDLRCSAPRCDWFADHDTCCEPLGTCDTLECPAVTHIRSNVAPVRAC